MKTWSYINNNMSKVNYKKIIYISVSIILLILWMLIVFFLSAEVADVSDRTSGNTIRWLITLFNKNITKAKLEELVILLQPITRKLAHFILYVLGGMLIYNLTIQFKEKVVYTKTLSILFGAMYAVTDEIHQLLVPGRCGELRDVIIDSSGVTVGVLFVYLGVKFLEIIKMRNK